MGVEHKLKAFQTAPGRVSALPWGLAVSISDDQAGENLFVVLDETSDS